MGNIGQNIKNARKEKGWTQKKLGSESGIAEPTIRRYELGKLNPKYETLAKIADALGVSVDLLYYGEEPDREYENLLDTLDAVGLSIEATGFMDNYYIWHTEAEDPAEDRVELEYAKLLSIVTAASAAAELRKDEFLRKRLDADIF